MFKSDEKRNQKNKDKLENYEQKNRYSERFEDRWIYRQIDGDKMRRQRYG